MKTRNENEVAIEYLEEGLKCYPKDSTKEYQRLYHQVATTSVSALKKQLPIKPDISGNEIICLCCKNEIGETSYCPYCGQALDWSDTDANI